MIDTFILMIIVCRNAEKRFETGGIRYTKRLHSYPFRISL